jgi:cyclic pyranopterin phosphate synthase
MIAKHHPSVTGDPAPAEKSPDRLMDSFRRQVVYMRVSITDRCDLRCSYCMPPWGNHWMPQDTLLSYAELLRVIRIAADRGVYKVRVTGGEPLIRPGAVDFVRRLVQVPGIRQVALTTNGVHLAKHARSLYRVGLRKLNVSLDSLNRERFAQITRSDRLQQVWEGILAAIDAGFELVKINCVVQKGVNDDEVADLAALTATLPLDVRFIEFMPVADWDLWKRRYVSADDILARIERRFGGLTPLTGHDPGAGPAEHFRIAGHVGRVGVIRALSHDFCDRCNRIRLTADGKLRPCLFGRVAMDFRQPLQTGATDEALATLLDEALAIKPDGHQLSWERPERMLQSMISIGG